jgi:hypothetical protein
MKSAHCTVYWGIFDRWQPILDQAREDALKYLILILEMDKELQEHEDGCKECS